MKAVSPVLLLMALLVGCNDAKQSSEKSPSSSEGSVATAPVDYLSSAADAQKKATRTIDVVAINKAIEAFYVQEGRFPKTLEELESKGFMRSLPLLPPGKKLNYDTNTGVVEIEDDLGKQ